MATIAGLDGYEISMVGLGCNNFGMRCDEAQSKAVVDASLDVGINLFDTADSYGGGRSEEFLGRALGARRNDVLIATKFGSPTADGGGAAPEYVHAAVDRSLRRLGTDRIDLYQIHFPDSAVAIEDTLGALDDVVRAGKVRAIGCSNFNSSQLQAAADASAAKGTVGFVTVQNEYSLLQRRPDKNVLAACERLGMGFLPYFPLASGLLTGKYKRGEEAPAGTRLASMPEDRRSGVLTDENLDRVEQLEKFAAARQHTLLELAMSWLAGRPAMTCIIAGATRQEQVRANAAAVSWRLDESELAEIDALVPLPG
jgi:aryl-alcohol dehydrogenase-like predicted oxidoreductase